MQGQDLLSDLIGTWHFKRTVTGQAHMIGQAVFSAQSSGRFYYDERGKWRLNHGREIYATRQYVFAPLDDAGISIFFIETPLRLFQNVCLHDKRAFIYGEGTHICGEDSYFSHYTFQEHQFFIRHTVKGPRKGHVISTQYTRTPSW